MNVLHKIKALLYENFLTENPNDYIARVSSERTLNVKDIFRWLLPVVGLQQQQQLWNIM